MFDLSQLHKEEFLFRIGELDRMVFRYCHKAAIPVAVTMAGGYAKNIQDSVDIHFQTVKQAVEWYHHRNLGLALEPKSS
jgi:acetoin utilization deacetylase AcuC-like enzyme